MNDIILPYLDYFIDLMNYSLGHFWLYLIWSFIYCIIGYKDCYAYALNNDHFRDLQSHRLYELHHNLNLWLNRLDIFFVTLGGPVVWLWYWQRRHDNQKELDEYFSEDNDKTTETKK